jgi:hypothetical protein
MQQSMQMGSMPVVAPANITTEQIQKVSSFPFCFGNVLLGFVTPFSRFEKELVSFYFMI